MKDIAAITGIAETAYVRGSPKTPSQLQIEAALAAIRDAGLSPKDIDGIIPASIGGAGAEELLTNFGIPDLQATALTPMGGASSIAAIQSAAALIGMGVCRHVLVCAGRRTSQGPKVGSRLGDLPQFQLVAEFEMPMGVVSPAQFYSLMARRHMALYGTTSEQLGAIAVSTRQHALLNENAIMKKPITLDDHQRSRMIADPFRLLDCSLESDGGAAFVVSAAAAAKDSPHAPTYVIGVAEGHADSPSSITQRPDMTRLGIAKAAPRAFAMAGVTPADIDFAEIYDCFTWVVLCQLEDMGFCKKGEGGAFVEAGRISLGGALPVNTHGGLLSQAHMLGMNHVVELVRQLRGQGGRAQVQDAGIGLATGYGDMGDGALVIMRRG